MYKIQQLLVRSKKLGAKKTQTIIIQVFCYSSKIVPRFQLFTR